MIWPHVSDLSYPVSADLAPRVGHVALVQSRHHLKCKYTVIYVIFVQEKQTILTLA